jgi:antitoxin MazE
MATTNIVRWGNSRGVRLPKPLLDSVHLSDNDAVEITTEGDSIIIKKAAGRKHRTLKERLAGFDGSYVFDEWDTGPAVGKEIFREEEGNSRGL